MTAMKKTENSKSLTRIVRTLLAEASSGEPEVDPSHRIARAHAFVDCALIFKVAPLSVFDSLKKEILDTAADQRTIDAQKARSFKRATK